MRPLCRATIPLVVLTVLGAAACSNTTSAPREGVRHQQFIDPPWISLVRWVDPRTPPTSPISEAKAASSYPTSYTVKAGDCLWTIAKRFRVNLSNLAIVNHMNLWDLIVPGQVLKLPDPKMPPPAKALPLSPPGQAVSEVVAAPAPYRATAYFTPSGGFQACVIQRESGGNPNARSPSGTYWGLYQFSYSTWVANGGPPSEYGNASAAQQTAVFDRSSPSNWAPYDGC